MQDQKLAAKRLILEKVADGKLTADEAARLLSAGIEEPQTETAVEGRMETRERTKFTNITEPISEVRIDGTFRSVHVDGDSSVSWATADGPHRVRHSGGVLIFEDDLDDENSWVTTPGYINWGGRRNRSYRFNIPGPLRNPPPLRVRMNPSLPLTLDLTAGTSKVIGVKGRIKTKLAAGTLRIEDFEDELEADVEAGSVIVEGKISKGTSRINCTAGKVRVTLDRDSDVKIVARATLGKISLPHEHSSKPEWAGIGETERDALIGAGTGRLDISAITGSVSVELR